MSSTTRVSTTSTGQQANGNSNFGQSGDQIIESVLSPDGSQIVFDTNAANITGAVSSAVVVKNLATGQDSVESSGITNASDSIFSPDGGSVVFDAAPTIGGGQQVYETPIATGQPILVSSSGAGVAGNGYSVITGVSTNGSRVAFGSTSTNLTGGTTPYSGATDFEAGNFVKDLTTGQTIEIGDAFPPSATEPLSQVVATTPDLREALFADYPQSSSASPPQLQAENLTTGSISLVSSDASGNAGNQGVNNAFITPDGMRAVFESDSTNLRSDAPAGGIFVKTLSTGAINLVVADQRTATGANSSSGLENQLGTSSTDGTKFDYIADTYTKATSADGTLSGTRSDQLKVENLATGTVSTAPVTVGDTYSYNNSSAGYQFSDNGTSFAHAVLSPDGTKIAYVENTSSNLTASYNSTTGQSTSSGTGTSQVFVYDTTTGLTTPVSPVTNTSTSYELIQFSPDGKNLAYLSASFATGTSPYGQTLQSVLVNLATGAQTVIPTDEGPVSFAPNSASVAFASTYPLVPGDTNGASDVFIQPLCFASGTLIRTVRGDVAVEALVVGDRAVTASGATRPIMWIGRRVLDCAAMPAPSEGWPVRVRAGAFGVGAGGDSLPERDLQLSPGHPVLVDDGACEGGEGGVLVPIMCLINGTSIARVSVDRVTYWHVELDAHDILLAEGLPAESYLDLGSRAWFAGGEGSDDRLTDPDLAAPAAPGRCRPVAVDGPAVTRERRRLDALFAAGLAAHCHWTGGGSDNGPGLWPGAIEGSPAS